MIGDLQILKANEISHIRWTHYPSMRTKMIEKKWKTKTNFFDDRVYMNDNELIECLLHLVPWLLPREMCIYLTGEKEINNLLCRSQSRPFLCKWKIDEIVIEWIFIFLWFSLTWITRENEKKREERCQWISFVLLMWWFHLNEWMLLLFFFRFSHSSYSLNQYERIGHRCRPSCLISILTFQTMIIHAVSLSPHS